MNKTKGDVDTNKENRAFPTLSNKFTNVRHTLSTIHSNNSKVTRVTTLSSIGNQGARSNSIASDANKETSTDSGILTSNIKSAGSKVKRIATSRKSRQWKRDSLTLNVNPLLKKVMVHPPKPKKRKSIQLKSPHAIQTADDKGTGSTTGTLKKTFTKPTDKFVCTLCKKTFFYKTTLETHNKTHVAVNSCQYCQRTFAIPSTLAKHLREHCKEISIAQRKKLLADDEKTSILNRTTVKTPSKTRTSSKDSDELMDFAYKFCSTSQSTKLKESMQYFPPIKGVYQTPKKLIKCDCGEKFKNPFLFATHAERCAVDRAVDN